MWPRGRNDESGSGNQSGRGVYRKGGAQDPNNSPRNNKKNKECFRVLRKKRASRKED